MSRMRMMPAINSALIEEMDRDLLRMMFETAWTTSDMIRLLNKTEQ